MFLRATLANKLDTSAVPSADYAGFSVPLTALLDGRIDADLLELGLPNKAQASHDAFVPDQMMSFLEHFLVEEDLDRLRDAVDAQHELALESPDTVAVASSAATPTPRPFALGPVDPNALSAKLNALLACSNALPI
jgi:hypothetical protein